MKIFIVGFGFLFVSFQIILSIAKLLGGCSWGWFDVLFLAPLVLVVGATIGMVVGSGLGCAIMK